MRHQPWKRWIVLLVLCVASGSASAHQGHDLSGFAAGFSHPFTGLDHLLAMVAVGLWAACGGSRKAWLLPATFMTSMVASAALVGLTHFPPSLEAGIAASVMVLGLVTALSLQLPAMLSLSITALSGALHGAAHGMEIPASAAPLSYALGFLAATVALHAAGVTFGLLSGNRSLPLARMAGVAIAMSGAWMLSGAMA